MKKAKCSKFAVLLGCFLLVGMLSGCAGQKAAEHAASYEKTELGSEVSPESDAEESEASVVKADAESEEPGSEITAGSEKDARAEIVPEPDAEEEPEENAESAQNVTAELLPENSMETAPEGLVADATDVEGAAIEEEAVVLADASPAILLTVSPVAAGVLEEKNSSAIIDYSNTANGYVMVKYTAQTTQRLKVQIKGPTTKYTYNITAGQWEVFPLSDGNGTYQITIYQNVVDTKYAAVLSLTTVVTLANEFEPFLHSNQYVNYDSAPKTVAKAAELIGGVEDPLEKVEIIYDYVVKGLTYDQELAVSVTNGYLPVLDTVLANQKGICFDYAALMTGMLRSQGIPCKLVVGYAGTAYHAWISVWSEDTGWIDGIIYFNGSSWQRMDPTFASSGNSSESIMAYIGNGANYAAKYFY